MTFDATSQIASLVIGSVGFVALVYGKKQGRLPQMLVGFALMVFPYFVPNVAWMIGIAAALLGGLWLLLRLGF